MPKKAVDKDALSKCHCLALRRAARRINQLYDEKLAATSLRSTQFTLLSAVRLHEGLSVNELAEILELDRTTTGKNLLPLERLGYLAVAPSPTDARTKVLALTRSGHEVVERAHRLWMQAQAEFERENGTEATRSLRTALDKLA